jgi:hypothetical protein
LPCIPQSGIEQKIHQSVKLMHQIAVESENHGNPLARIVDGAGAAWQHPRYR